MTTSSSAGAHTHDTPTEPTVLSRLAVLETAVATLQTAVTALTASPVIVPVPTVVPFLGWPKSAPVNFVGQTNVEVKSLSFQSPGGTNVPVRIEGCTNVWIHDCDFADLALEAILVLTSKGTVKIERCRYREVGHNFVQFDKTIASGYILNNKGIGGLTEDIISMYASGGTSATDLFVIAYNSFEGTDWTSGSGSGFMLADNGGGHILAKNNTLLNPGQVGIGISGGVDCHVTDNVIFGVQRPNSNVGLYSPYVSGSPNPGGHEVARNRVNWTNAAGHANPAWDGGASGTIAGWSTNVWQDTTIDPATLAVVL